MPEGMEGFGEEVRGRTDFSECGPACHKLMCAGIKDLLKEYGQVAACSLEGLVLCQEGCKKVTANCQAKAARSQRDGVWGRPPWMFS